MTGSTASPMTRTCAVCQTSFIPRRSDAEFCSNRCRQKGHRRRKSNPSLQIVAEINFPLDLERAELAAAATISWLNERAAQLGVVFIHLGLTFDVRETFSGAADLAEKNDRGPIGQYLRLLRSIGWFSPSPKVREVLVEHTYRTRNKAILRDTKAVLDRDHEEWRHISNLKRLQNSILNGDAYIESAIRPLPEHRGISIGTPSIMPRPTPPPELKVLPFERKRHG